MKRRSIDTSAYVSAWLILGFIYLIHPYVGASGSRTIAETGRLDDDVSFRSTADELESFSEESGDIVTLKSGRQLRGFWVVRETPAFYELEIIEGRVSLQVPRNQVLSVHYDESAARPGVRGSTRVEPQEQVLLPGRQLSPQLMQGLTKDISDPPVVSDGDDYLVVLDELCERADVRIQVSSEIRDFATADRRWFFALPEGGTLQYALQALDDAFSELCVEYASHLIRIAPNRTIPDTQPHQPPSSDAR